MIDVLQDFLIDEAFIVVAALWIIGMFIKESPLEKDWLIPFLLLPLGMLGTTSLMGVTPDAILQGVVVTGIAVYGYQLYKQAKERD